MRGPGGLNYLNMLPDFTNNWDLAVAVFIIPIAVQWWAVWYPGAEPGGGSYIAQRMLASKSEKDALGGTLFFNVAHYVLRPWPWILVGLASLIVYPELSDIQKAFPEPGSDADRPRHRLSGDAALPAGRLDGTDAGRPDRRQLLHHSDPPQLGRVVPGARFLPPLREDRARPRSTTSWPGGCATVLLFVCSSALVFALDTAKDSFNLILQIGAGTGLLYLVRWFWWRVTAWCEIVAMISSFGVALIFLVLAKNGVEFGISEQLIIGIAITTVCWIAAAYLGPQTDPAVLVDFYEKVRPFGPGWRRIQAKASVAEVEGDNIPLALIGWTMGCTMIWSALFTVGNFLYGRTTYALILGADLRGQWLHRHSGSQETLEVGQTIALCRLSTVSLDTT